MQKFLLLLAVFLAGCCCINAQTGKRTEPVNQLWFAYFNQTRLSDKWGLWADFHLRTKENFADNFSTGIARLGLTYYLTDATKLTAGYAFVNHFPAEAHKKISQPEHRPWQQLQWHTKYGKKQMMQYIRLEERFRRKILNDSSLADGHHFNFKVRYNIWYEIPLGKKNISKGSLSAVLNDEVHINFGKEIVNNYFDQNRLFVGLKYQVGEHSNFQAGYMNLFQQLSAGNRYRNIHSIRLFFLQNIDLRGKG